MTVTRLHPIHNSAPKRRILVVDDSLDFVQSMRFLIQDMGHEVEFAINGFAALDIAREFRPDVVLLDMKLPDFDGPTIAKQLKWELPQAVFVAISASSDDLHRRKALDAGCAEYHVKPLDPTVLERIVSTPT